MILPWFVGEDLVGQLDLINERAFRFGRGAFGGMTVEDVPPEFRSQVADLRSELVARIADLDDSVAALWLENQRVPPAVLKAEVPLSELWGYANAIRCLSRGRASYSMTPLQFEVVPAALATEILQGHTSR